LIDVVPAAGAAHCTHHVYNQAVRDQTGCTPVSELIKKRRPRLFDHIARSNVELTIAVPYVQRLKILRHPGEGQEGVRDTLGPAQWNPTCIRSLSACTLPGVELKTIQLGEHL